MFKRASSLSLPLFSIIIYLWTFFLVQPIILSFFLMFKGFQICPVEAPFLYPLDMFLLVCEHLLAFWHKVFQVHLLLNFVSRSDISSFSKEPWFFL